MKQKIISILGAGKIGLALAFLWAKAGNSVYIGTRNPEKLRLMLKDMSLQATAESISNAVKLGDIIVLAVPHPVLNDLIPQISANLSKKIVIDATNPFGLSSEGHVISTLEDGMTQGVYMANLLPKSIVIRAFTHIMDELLISRGIRHPGLFAMAVAGDNSEAKSVVFKLVEDTGFVPIDIGTLKESAPLDPGGILFPQFFTVADMRLTLRKTKKEHKQLETKDLLHLARDHFLSGCYLLENPELPSLVFESGGVLIHLGFELLFKTFFKYKNKNHQNKHDLLWLKNHCGIDIKNMLDEINFSCLDDSKNCNEHVFFEIMNDYFNLKYCESIKESAREIGNNELSLIEEVFFTIIEKMPKELKSEYDTIDPCKKAGGVLMEKPIVN